MTLTHNLPRQRHRRHQAMHAEPAHGRKRNRKVANVEMRDLMISVWRKDVSHVDGEMGDPVLSSHR